MLGTSNKTEILLGYSTIFGDNASSINPLGDLFKQQVWQLARHLDIPARSRRQGPISRSLARSDRRRGAWFRLLDGRRGALSDLRLAAGPKRRSATPGILRDSSKIIELEERNRYKRRLMLIARLSASAINSGPRDPSRLSRDAREAHRRIDTDRQSFRSFAQGSRALENADLVACEDTRRTGRLLSARDQEDDWSLSTNTTSDSGYPNFLQRWKTNQRLVLVSDAGTPSCPIRATC